MAEITKEKFQSLTNEQLWELFHNKSIVESSALKELNTKLDLVLGKVEKLEDQIAVGKAANAALKCEIANLKRKLNRDSLYNRQENVEFSGIPVSVSDGNLEKTVMSLLRKVGVEVVTDDIVDCHRLKDKKTVITRFVNRKYAVQALSNSKRLRGNTNDILANSVIYINRNLTPEYKTLRWKAKRMCLAGHIHAFGTSKRGVWVKADANASKKQVDLEEDLYQFLPAGISLSDICS